MGRIEEAIEDRRDTLQIKTQHSSGQMGLETAPGGASEAALR